MGGQMKKAVEIDYEIRDIRRRGLHGRDKLFRKLSEEVGEYAEAIELLYGNKRKVEKFLGLNSMDRLRDEITDVIMIALCLAEIDGLGVDRVLDSVLEKIKKFSMENK